MAVNPNNKVFVVNENINTRYGGVDPTGEFVTVSELTGYNSIVIGNIIYDEFSLQTSVVQSSFAAESFIFNSGVESINGFDLILYDSNNDPLDIKADSLVILTSYNWNQSVIFSASLQDSDLANGIIHFGTSDLVGNKTNCDGASLEVRIYTPAKK